MKSNLVWLVLAVVAVVGGYMWYDSRPSYDATMETPTSETRLADSETPSMSDSIVFDLTEQNDLGQSGTATFTSNAEGNLVVTLAMSGGSFTAPQPAHIHLGSCPTPGAVEYPLANVVDGVSETVLDTTWSALEASGKKLALNVHKSSAESKVYTACGDLPIPPAADNAVMELDTEASMSVDY